MEAETVKPLGLLTIEEAARRCGLSFYAMRRLVLEHGIGIRVGGTDQRPRLRVTMKRIRRALLADQYVPPSAPRMSRDRHGALHPDVRC